MKGVLRLLAQVFLASMIGALPAIAATIAGPSTSTNGNFTLTWPAGYNLRAVNPSWQYATKPTTSYAASDWPSGTYKFELVLCTTENSVTTCDIDAGSQKTVTVTRDAEIAINTTTTEAGTTTYKADVTPQGDAAISVPIRVIPGVNGMAPELTLSYVSGRKGYVTDYLTMDDSLGYGWYLGAPSMITACRTGTVGSSTPYLNTSDSWCFGGAPMQRYAGIHMADNSEYRAGPKLDIKVIAKTGAWGRWFEVSFPDGRVAKYGDDGAGSGDSLVNAGHHYDTFYTSGVSPNINPHYAWAIKSVTNAFGDTMTYNYRRQNDHGMLTVSSINYAGASVEFKYGPRGELAHNAIGASSNTGKVWRNSYLHTILVKNGSTKVREYRLDSNADASGRVRLEAVQECGYDTTGMTVSCLKPLTIAWTDITGGSVPIAVSALTDGLGAVTEFTYATVTPTSNPTETTYTETPFGNTYNTTPGDLNPFNAAAGTLTVVSQFKWSDGLTPTGRRSMTYAYKGSAWDSTDAHGMLGFFESRAKDDQRGVYTYRQFRLDAGNELQGQVAAVRQTAGNTFGGTGAVEMERAETAFGMRTWTTPSGMVIKDAFPIRVTRWVLEGGETVGASEEVLTRCYRMLIGDTCPGSGTEGDFETQLQSVQTAGDGIDDLTFIPALWGDVRDRTVSSVKHTATRIANLTNITSPWVVGNPTKTIATDVEGSDSRTVINSYTYIGGTREIESATATFPGHTNLTRTLTRFFTGNNLTAEEISGSGFATRDTGFGPAYVDDRYPPSVTNALGHQTTLAYDARFGQPNAVTDPNIRTRAIAYDSFGRVVSDAAADGTTTSNTYTRCDAGSCPAVLAGAVAALKITTTVMNGTTQVAPTRTRFLDVLGREVLVQTEILSGSAFSRVRTRYDNAGRRQYVTRPYLSGIAAPSCASAADATDNCTWFDYDARGRVTQESRPDGGVIETAFAGATGKFTVTVTETVKKPNKTTTDATRVKRSEFNVLGQLTKTTDAYGTGSAIATEYAYTSHGDLRQVLVGGVEVASMSYNPARARIEIEEPNSGTTTIEVNALGELTKTTDAKLQTAEYQYDLLGRLLTRVDTAVGLPTVSNSWTWDPANAKGALGSRSNGTAFTETWTYAAGTNCTSPDYLCLGRPKKVETTINVPGVLPSTTFSKSFTYDAQGRVSSLKYPNAEVVNRTYTTRGFLSQLTSGATVLQEYKTVDEFGNVTREEFQNNSFATARTFDSNTGRLLTIQTGVTATPSNVQNLVYRWRSNSTLLSRKDVNLGNATDTFTYDSLERVTSQSTSGAVSRTLDFGFSTIGNLTSKLSNVTNDLDVSSYSYNTDPPPAQRPQRLESVAIGGISNSLYYDANGNVTLYDAVSGDDTTLVYDARNNVTLITVGAAPTAQERFWYDPDGQRFLGKASWPGQSVVTAYVGDYEEARPGSGTPAATIQRVQASNVLRRITQRNASDVITSNVWEYAHRDHLGSVDVVTNESGVTFTPKTSFDAFGAIREPTWASDLVHGGAAASTLLTNEQLRHTRGFTDHEQLHRTGFVHMNGRVYDTRIGRFVSPDPIVANPYSSQSYNRYSYVMNSPMSFTDPSGFATVADDDVAPDDGYHDPGWLFAWGTSHSPISTSRENPFWVVQTSLREYYIEALLRRWDNGLGPTIGYFGMRGPNAPPTFVPDVNRTGGAGRFANGTGEEPSRIPLPDWASDPDVKVEFGRIWSSSRTDLPPTQRYEQGGWVVQYWWDDDGDYSVIRVPRGLPHIQPWMGRRPSCFCTIVGVVHSHVLRGSDWPPGDPFLPSDKDLRHSKNLGLPGAIVTFPGKPEDLYQLIPYQGQ